MSQLCACTGLMFCDACTVGRYAGALCACVMCLAVYMCILSFFSPDCTGGLLQMGEKEQKEEISVGELTVSNL